MKKILSRTGLPQAEAVIWHWRCVDTGRRGKKVIALDLPLYPEEAIALIEREIRIHRPQLVVGSSCGGFYARMFVSAHRKVILINPYFAMTEFLQTRIGTQPVQVFACRPPQEFKVTQRLVKRFQDDGNGMKFADYTCATNGMSKACSARKTRWRIFALSMTGFYVHAKEFDGGHTMTLENVKEVLAPLAGKC